MTPETLAPLLYEAYRQNRGWVDSPAGFDVVMLSPWSNVKDDERGAWVAAAREAIGQMHAALRPTHDDLMVTPESIDAQTASPEIGEPAGTNHLGVGETMKVIYIAGKYRGPNAWAIEQNIRAAEDLAAKVWGAGMAALCPHANSRHMEGVASDEVFLAGTLELMRRCDAVLLAHNWRDSAGAVAEVEEAKRLGIPVFGLAQKTGEPDTWALDSLRLWAFKNEAT